MSANAVILAVIAAVILTGYAWVGSGRRRERPMQILARELGFAWEPADLFGAGESAVGTIEGAEVRVLVGGRDTLDVSIGAGPPDGLRIFTHSTDDSSKSYPIGDDRFDRGGTLLGTRHIRISGESPVPEAVLTHPIRERILALREQMSLAAEFHQTRASIAADWDEAAARVREITSFALALSARPSDAAAVAENVAAEPDSGVRAQNFEALLGLRDDEAIERGCRAALGDERLAIVARALIPSSRASLFADPPESASRLSRVAPDLQSAAVRGIARAGAEAIPLLLEIWRRAKERDVEDAAVIALGDCADVSVVPALRERYAGFLRTPVRDLALEAIAKIQARAQGSTGDVSLVGDSTEGAVSIAQNAGAISIAKPLKG